MANCLNCGTPLPSFSFGDASPLCQNCRRAEQQAAQLQAPPRTKPWDELPQAATFGPAWFSATYFLIAVNVIIFAIMVAKGVSFRLPSSYDILTWGGEFAPATLSGEYWRLITAAFLHIGIFHLAVNMWALYVVVPPIERLFGRTMTSAVYLLTGVGASLLSLSWNTTTVSAGASGAVFGFIGLIISFFHFARLNVRPELVSTIRSWAMRMAVINLLFGFSVTGINNMAHLGGLVTGLIMGTFLAFTFHHPVEERFAGQVRVALISAVALAGIFGFILRAKADVREMGLGDAALRRNDTSAAIAHFQKSVALKPNNAAAHVALASALASACFTITLMRSIVASSAARVRSSVSGDLARTRSEALGPETIDPSVRL